jgi:hypothetical protein
MIDGKAMMIMQAKISMAQAKIGILSRRHARRARASAPRR